MQIYQPQSYPKIKHKPKVPIKHQELQHSISLEKLDDQKWMEEINKELIKFQQLIHQIEEIQSKAAQEDHLMSQGSYKLIMNDYKYTSQKLHTIHEQINDYKKSLEQPAQGGKKKPDYALVKQRDYIQLQFTIAHRVLAFIEAYIKLQDQYENQHELQRHSDYILQKIAKIKQLEEKHQKKLHHYYQGIVVEDNLNDENMEQQVEQEQDDDEEVEEDEGFQHSQKEELIKLCDCLISYLKTFKEDNHRINYDLVTLQQFDQIQVAAPFHFDKINITLELITAKKTYYENVSESDLLKKQQIKEDQQQKALDINDEKDFPKLE